MRGCKREPERVPSFTTHFDSNRRFRTAHRTRVGREPLRRALVCLRSPGPVALELTAADRKLAEEMSSYWVNFARSGDPNGAGLPSWPAFATAGSKVQYLGDPITVGGVANIDTLKVFDAVYVRGKPFAAR